MRRKTRRTTPNTTRTTITRRQEREEAEASSLFFVCRPARELGARTRTRKLPLMRTVSRWLTLASPKKIAEWKIFPIPPLRRSQACHVDAFYRARLLVAAAAYAPAIFAQARDDYWSRPRALWLRRKETGEEVRTVIGQTESSLSMLTSNAARCFETFAPARWFR